MDQPEVPRSESRRSYSDLIANAAIVLMCLTVVAYLGQKLLAKPPQPTVISPYRAGESFDLISEKERPSSDRTLIMVVRSGCQFCTESMPFYKRLLDQNPAPDQRRIVVMSTDPVPTATSYLSTHGIEGLQVLPLPIAAKTHINGTPTLVLVDRSWKVLKAWNGKLNPEQERELESSWKVTESQQGRPPGL